MELSRDPAALAVLVWVFLGGLDYTERITRTEHECLGNVGSVLKKGKSSGFQGVRDTV